MIKTALTSRYSVVEQIYKYRNLYIMLIPVIIYFIMFHYLPMYGVIIAFKDFDIIKGIMDSPWAGFKYFKQVLTDEYFWMVFRNTMLISLYKIIFAFPIPIILALIVYAAAKCQ